VILEIREEKPTLGKRRCKGIWPPSKPTNENYTGGTWRGVL